MDNRFELLEKQSVSPRLISDLENFVSKYDVDKKAAGRLIRPEIFFYGKEILEMGIAALLRGENLLLTGPKATGKNVLAETLAYLFNRPVYNVSFHVNTSSAELIGTDTFRDGEVQLRKGSIYRCAEVGGFGILDEINMAKNDAVSVLHATLDYRRSIDMPGYDKIELHPAARFIGTMNFGYAGTKELNEALVSRFLVIDMPPQTEETLVYVFRKYYPDMKPEAMKAWTGLFLDLQEKAAHGEISTKALDLRGMIGAAGVVAQGLNPSVAIEMGVVGKCFDPFEKDIVRDVVRTRIPDDCGPEDVF
ncbi:MAG: AAA family ATPase [Eubacterium sp.]|nr:AAA family ATPase [Eubacterium sp.]